MLWLDGKNFARPALPNQPGQLSPIAFGNAGVGILRGPGINNWDMRVARRFPLRGERRVLEFRGEFFNFPNHTQLAGLDTSARFDQQGNQINSQFLLPNSSRRPRQIQFALKLYW